MPMLFSPTIGAAIPADYWFLRARCLACRTVGDVGRTVSAGTRGAAVTALTPALSRRMLPAECAVRRASLSVEVERGRGALRGVAIDG
jgi:hypothetical protein